MDMNKHHRGLSTVVNSVLFKRFLEIFEDHHESSEETKRIVFNLTRWYDDAREKYIGSREFTDLLIRELNLITKSPRAHALVVLNKLKSQNRKRRRKHQYSVDHRASNSQDAHSYSVMLDSEKSIKDETSEELTNLLNQQQNKQNQREFEYDGRSTPLSQWNSHTQNKQVKHKRSDKSSSSISDAPDYCKENEQQRIILEKAKTLEKESSRKRARDDFLESNSSCAAEQGKRLKLVNSSDNSDFCFNEISPVAPVESKPFKQKMEDFRNLCFSEILEEDVRHKKLIEVFLNKHLQLVPNAKIKSELLDTWSLYGKANPDYIASDEFFNLIRIKINSLIELLYENTRDVWNALYNNREESEKISNENEPPEINEVEPSSTQNVTSPLRNTPSPSQSTPSPPDCVPSTSRDVVNSPKSVPSSPPLLSPPSPKKKKRWLKKLYDLLEVLQQEIKKWDEKDTETNSEGENAYILSARYRARYNAALKTICQLEGRSFDVGRNSQRPLKFNDTPYPPLNKAIEALYNKHRIFPDYNDIFKIVQKVNETGKLNLSNSQMNTTARMAFKGLGEKLRNLRHEELDDFFSYYISESNEDPAADDFELETKLCENRVKYHKKEEEVMHKYSTMHEIGDISSEKSLSSELEEYINSIDELEECDKKLEKQKSEENYNKVNPDNNKDNVNIDIIIVQTLNENSVEPKVLDEANSSDNNDSDKTDKNTSNEVLISDSLQNTAVILISDNEVEDKKDTKSTIVNENTSLHQTDDLDGTNDHITKIEKQEVLTDVETSLAAHNNDINSPDCIDSAKVVKPINDEKLDHTDSQSAEEHKKTNIGVSEKQQNAENVESDTITNVNGTADVEVIYISSD